MVAWDQGCMSKNEGGLGIEHLDTMNKAFLTKWRWKIIAKLDSQLCWVIKEKYQSREGTWARKEQNSSNISTFWRDISSVKEIFWAWLKFEVGNERDINFRRNRWIQEGRIKDLVPTLFMMACKLDSLVKDNYTRGRCRPRLRYIRGTVLEDKRWILKDILNGKNPLTNNRYTPIWIWDVNKQFSIT